MSLSDPLPHRLVEGEIGEVIPAELLQRTAAFGDSAVEMLHRDHERDFRGLMQHRGLEYASAAACFVVPVFAGTEWREIIEGDIGGFNLWGFGWDEEPRLVKDPASYNQDLKTSWVRFYIECTMPGLTVEPFLHASAEFADAGLGAAGPLVVIKRNKKFRIYVGAVAIADPGGDAIYTPTYELTWMRRVYLWAIK